MQLDKSLKDLLFLDFSNSSTQKAEKQGEK
jgi:hypothetical protein